jgi:membrane-bound metal-dependent hydrolase YbcI (DUF457 family)
MAKSFPQLFAAFLAVGGLLWAFLLGVAGASGGFSGILSVVSHFGLGYLIWAAWVIRSFWAFRFELRVSMWIVSVAYNGAYLIGNFRGFRTHTAELPIYWWGAALILSLISLILERREMPNQSTDPTLSSGTPAAGQPARHP